LTLSRAQLDGRQVTLEGDSGTLVFGGDATAIDLGGVAAGVGFRVAAGRSLTLTAEQADGRAIDGAGNVYVTQLGEAPVDLSGVTAGGVLSASVPADATLDPATDLGGF